MAIIDSQVHAYEANTPKRPWHSVQNWPDHVTGDEMVAAMDKVDVDGAIFVSAFSMYRSGGRRCHRRLEEEEDAGHGRHPHHDGREARAERPGPRPDPARGRPPRFSAPSYPRVRASRITVSQSEMFERM
jgi:hypothetical protein